MLTQLFPFLAPTEVSSQLTQRLRRLADDLDRINAGDAPTKADIAAAPLLVDWRIARAPTGICLAGSSVRHPILGSGVMMTSPLWAADPEMRWIRTLSRFYRLGAAADFIVPPGSRH
jgi:hypothetical protein